ncbi:hypothetical protein PC112_g6725 [Phytophthora cactorum]|nr:hypothetical protein PC112_g6725 [Phytophthora cactorum]
MTPSDTAELSAYCVNTAGLRVGVGLPAVNSKHIVCCMAGDPRCLKYIWTSTSLISVPTHGQPCDDSKTVTCANAILYREASKSGNLLVFGKRAENMEPCYKRLHLQNVGRDGAVPDNTTVHTNSASGYLLSLVNNLILSDVEFVVEAEQLQCGNATLRRSELQACGRIVRCCRQDRHRKPQEPL